MSYIILIPPYVVICNVIFAYIEGQRLERARVYPDEQRWDNSFDKKSQFSPVVKLIFLVITLVSKMESTRALTLTLETFCYFPVLTSQVFLP